jgi:AraC-like DNA-binding protein
VRNFGQANLSPLHYNLLGMEHSHRVQTMIGLIETRLDSSIAGAELAARANYSRFHAQRVFRRATGETPGEFRRRLGLERAAYMLSHSKTSVTEVAFEAGYNSLEAFTRAFRKGFKVSPSHYRRVGTASFYLPAPNGIHYQPSSFNPGGLNMDFLDYILKHDASMMRKMLGAARQLSDAQLDTPIRPHHQPLPFEDAHRSLREMFHRQIFWKEVWLAAIKGRDFPENPAKTIGGMIERLDKAFPEFAVLAHEVRDQSKWEAVFVDALCTPPETFSFGGVVAHVLTFSIHQRFVILEALHHFGIHGIGYGDPMELSVATT